MIYVIQTLVCAGVGVPGSGATGRVGPRVGRRRSFGVGKGGRVGNGTGKGEDEDCTD